MSALSRTTAWPAPVLSVRLTSSVVNSSSLPAAYPRERLPLRRRVRIVEIVNEKLACVFVARAALGLNRLIALEAIAIAHTAVSLLVRHDVLDVIDSWIDGAARFEDNGLESVLGQLFCRPASGYPGADDNRVVIVWHFSQTAGVNGTLPS